MLRSVGDLATSISFTLAKRLKTSPMIIAKEIASFMETKDLIEKVNVAPPGYVNFYVDFKKLTSQTFNEVFENKKRFESHMWFVGGLMIYGL